MARSGVVLLLTVIVTRTVVVRVTMYGRICVSGCFPDREVTMTTTPTQRKDGTPEADLPDGVDLEQLVAEVDRGGRSVGGITGAVIFLGAVLWSLFQLWYVSPLPFTFHFAIFNDTEARALHLGIAMFLGYLAYPARKKSRRDH